MRPGIDLAIMGVCALAVILAAWFLPIGDVLATDAGDDAICDGIYCGGPITQSVLFPIAILVLGMGVIGLVIAFFGAGNDQVQP